MKHIKSTLAGLSLVTLSLTTLPSFAEKYRIQTAFNAGDYTLPFLIDNWVPKLSEMTEGRIELELMPTKSVVPHKETPEAVGAGILDGDWTSTPYLSGKNPAFGILGDLISGYDTPIQMINFCKDDVGAEMVQKALDTYMKGKVTVIACGPYTKEALASAVPIRTFEDLAGKKIRSPEGLAAAVFAGAGATPVSIPFSEVYTSLEKGIVDAADASAYANNSATGLNKIAKFPIYPGIHAMPSMQFSLNTNKYDKLSDEDKTALRDWWYMAMIAMSEEVDKIDKEVVAEDMAGGDIEVINWAQEDRDKLREVAIVAWEEFAEKNELAREALDAHLAYMKKIGLIKE